jgi:glycosyltransferase involved in cell wall biosynthesis
MTTVGAVVPNYNHAALIPEAIAALQAQTRPFDEIVVVDDGSTDDSLAVIARLAEADPRIRLIRHAQNRGAVAAINTGLGGATADVIHFAAADDRFAPTLVADLLVLLEAHPAAAFACAEVTLTDRATGRALGLRPPVRPAHHARFFAPHDSARLLARMDNFVVTPAALFRRAPITAMGGFDARLGPFADGHLVRRLALHHGFCFTPRVLAEWRVDDRGYSRVVARDPERAMALFRRALDAFAEDPAFPPWYPALFERRYRFGVARLALQAEPVDFATLTRMLEPGGAWLGLLRRLPAPLLRPALLAALTLRFRPTSLPGLLGTAIARRLGYPAAEPAR